MSSVDPPSLKKHLSLKINIQSPRESQKNEKKKITSPDTPHESQFPPISKAIPRSPSLEKTFQTSLNLTEKSKPTLSLDTSETDEEERTAQDTYENCLTQFQTLKITEKDKGIVTINGCYTYDTSKVLGHGAFGTVYEGTIDKSEQPVAIKVFRTNKPGVDIEELLFECRLGEACDHPNLVKVLEFGHDDDIVYIVMEKQQGSLSNAVTSDSTLMTNTAKFMKIAKDIMAGLAYLHRGADGRLNFKDGVGVIHRDIRTGNLFIGTDGTARIGDFGKAVPSNKETIDAVTSAYFPFGELPSFKTDIFGVGQALAELYCRARNIQLNRDNSFSKQLPNDTDPNIKALILRMTATQHGDRPDANTLLNTPPLNTI